MTTETPRLVPVTSTAAKTNSILQSRRKRRRACAQLQRACVLRRCGTLALRATPAESQLAPSTTSDQPNSTVATVAGFPPSRLLQFLPLVPFCGAQSFRLHPELIARRSRAHLSTRSWTNQTVHPTLVLDREVCASLPVAALLRLSPFDVVGKGNALLLKSALWRGTPNLSFKPTCLRTSVSDISASRSHAA